METKQATVPALSGKRYLFTKDWGVGDTVIWLGHDNVYGFMYGEQYIADERMSDHKTELQLWKCIKRIL